MGKGLTILPKKLLYKCSLELNIQSLYNHRASNFEFVTASTIMAVIEINLIYMIYSLLKMHLFFFRNSSRMSMYYTCLCFETSADWRSGKIYKPFSLPSFIFVKIKPEF